MTKKFFDTCPSLTYEEDKKYEYELYNNPLNENDRHQLKFDLFFESIEEFFEGLYYLTKNGWFNKIKFRYNLIPHPEILSYSWIHSRKNKISGRKEINDDNIDRDARLVIPVVVDIKRINEFRELLKKFDGYCTYWKIDNKCIIK